MASELKAIRKKDQVHSINGVIIDSLDSNSEKDAPSIRAVNEGKTSIKLDNVNQNELALSTQRTENANPVRVQITNSDGNVISLESTLDNTYVMAKDGTGEEKNAKDLFTSLYNLAKSGLYTTSPKAIFDEMDKFF